MQRLSKSLTFFLAAALLALCLSLVSPISAQSTATPTVTEFTVQYVTDSYYIPPQVTSSKDPYTGEITNSTTPGYTVDNSTVVATIKNPSGATYYNFRWKGSYDDTWRYYPFNPNTTGRPYFLGDWFSVPFPASSTSDYTECSLYFLPKEITPNGSIDIQVQALYGGFRAVPYGHAIDVGGPTYDFYFEGQAGDFSSTQTVSYSQTSPSPSVTPSPSVPEFTTLAILPIIAATLLVAALIRKRSPKTQTLFQKKVTNI